MSKGVYDHYKTKGKNNSGYIDGRMLKKHYCIECKVNEISYSTWRYGKKRCRKCYKKCIKKHSENSGRYIDGRTLIKSLCMNCKKLLNSYRAKRCSSCANRITSYIHGQGYEPYSSEFNNQLKEKIRKRDNYQCQNCSMTEEEHLIVYGRDIEIHHIDYDKENCNDNNLITLCKQCNLRANTNRDYWYAYFIYLMEI